MSELVYGIRSESKLLYWCKAYSDRIRAVRRLHWTRFYQAALLIFVFGIIAGLGSRNISYFFLPLVPVALLALTGFIMEQRTKMNMLLDIAESSASTAIPSDTKDCLSCGMSIVSEAEFCPECGKKQEK